MQDGLLALFPGINTHLAGQNAGIDADIGNRLGQGKGTAPGGAVRGRGAQGHVMVALLGGAAFVDGRQGQVVGERAGGCAGIDPGQLKGHQGQGHIFGAFDKAPLMRVQEDGCDAGFVEGFEQRILLLGPFVGVAHAVGDHAGDHAPGHAAGRLDGHLEIEAIGVAPHNLPDIVAREGAEGFHRFRLVLGLSARERSDCRIIKYGKLKYSAPRVNQARRAGAAGASGRGGGRWLPSPTRRLSPWPGLCKKKQFVTNPMTGRTLRNTRQPAGIHAVCPHVPLRSRF